MQQNSAPYHVTKLYDEQGQVTAPYVDEEFRSFGMSWDQAMANPHFSAIIERDLQAELIADAPLTHLAQMAPNQRVRALFEQWLAFIDQRLAPWTTGGAIHFRPHWARVLMLALIMGDAAGMSDADLNALAMAAVFHDSRRKNPYLDTGHGARAASYYADFAAHDALDVEESGAAANASGAAAKAPAPAPKATTAGGEATGPDRPTTPASPLQSITFDPRTFMAMQWHDRDDAEGIAAIKQALRSDLLTDITNGSTLEGPAGQSVREMLANDAQASGLDLYLMFKDADALDRVRLGAEGLDTRYLRTSYARDLVTFAHDLYHASEQLPGDDQRQTPSAAQGPTPDAGHESAPGEDRNSNASQPAGPSA